MRRSLLLLACAAGCDARVDAEPTDGWWGGPDALDVTEAIAFTDENYTFPADPADGLAALRADALAPSGDNDGPRIAPDDLHEDVAACTFWEEAPELPRVVEGVVTSYPRVYRKIEGCNGDERYYGSYHLQDGTGAIFVLRDSKVAAFDIGAKVRLEVRGIRRRYGIDMIYVATLLDVDRGPHPLFYEQVDRPLVRADQSRVLRAEGTVVTAPSTFGEVLVQLDGAEVCAPDDEVTRAPCLVVQLDQELGRRGVTFTPGERVRVTAPVAPATYFSPAGIFDFYGLYVTRLGQIERLDP